MIKNKSGFAFCFILYHKCLHRRLYEFIGSDQTNAVTNSSLAGMGNQGSPASPASAPIFTSIFAYYESKNVKELGTCK